MGFKPVVDGNWSEVSGEKPGLVVGEEDSHPKGSGFESCHILDGCKRSYLLHSKLKVKE